VQRITRQNAIFFAFVAIGLLSWLVIWWSFLHQTTQISLVLHDQFIAQGTLGSDPEWVWFTGNTQIVVNRFGDTPWRAMQWRWRQAPGTPLTVQLQLARLHAAIPATVPWRVVHLLMPTDQHLPLLDVQSATVRPAGDSRNLGVIMSYLRIIPLDSNPWWPGFVASDYFLLLGVAAIWLYRGRWLGVGAFVVLCSVYGAMVLQEVSRGFAQPSLWLDRDSRYILCLLMVGFAWFQRKRHVDSLAPQGRRFGLDVMRAVAILCVVVAHSTRLFFIEWASTRDVFKWFVNIGAIGVDIFFALSGYLIGAILLRALARFDDFAVVKRFLARRWLRTLPAAYVSAVVVWFVAPPKHIFDYFASILFVGLFNPWHFSTELTFWWSLSAEELFYLLFPLLLFLLIKKHPRGRSFALTIAIFAGFAMLSRVILAWALPFAIIDNMQYVSYACLDAMVWGILLQWLRHQYPDWFVRLSHIGFAPGAVVFASGIALLLDPLRWVEITLFGCHILIVIGAVLMIPAMESLKTLGWRGLDRVVAWIAVVSYSAYLYNAMMSDWVLHRFGPATSWSMLGQSLLLYFGLTFGASALSYYLVEAPVLRWRDRNVRETV